MSAPEPAGADDSRRRRATLRVLLVGLAVAVAAAGAAGLAGLPGQLGALALLLVGGLACAVAALHATGLALLDDLRGRRVTGRRLLLALALWLGAGLLVAMASAAAGG